ncbi:MAG TPA: HTH domain-containing protein, partial [Anaerolineales bacterium]|nr:HTH domain-containing protein [Anaerolineales bacterium]
GALNVSPRTVRADLAALRRQGHPVRTLGHLPR